MLDSNPGGDGSVVCLEAARPSPIRIAHQDRYENPKMLEPLVHDWRIDQVIRPLKSGQ